MGQMKENPIFADEAGAAKGVVFEVNGTRYQSNGLTPTGDVSVTPFNEFGELDPTAGPSIVRGSVEITSYSVPDAGKTNNG
ncbi:hypothetical protein HY469_00510 [Candidatus Roizmanbacteria bacterium]|nr:hypothetical protein [Candidatus Roizmanbacteria bacterium]